MKPLKVLYITPGGLKARGGMGSVARYLIAAFTSADQPISCHVIDSYGGGGWRMPFYFAASVMQVIFHAIFKTADLAHIHMSHRGSAVRKLILVRIAAALGLPTLLHVHGSEFEVYAESLSPAAKKKLVANLSYTSSIAVLGTKWRDYIVNKLGLDPKKIHIVHNGVPLPPLPEPMQTADRPCRIVALGLLSQRKGTPELLQALASPMMKALSWTALIAGNGAVDRFRAEAASLGLSNRVEMPGWLSPEEAQQKLSDADIFVLPSHNEGLPMAILEAMAKGIPVITTPVGAIPDLVIQDQTGIMVPAGDAVSLASALASLVNNSGKRLQMGQKARQKIISEFTVLHCTQNVIGIYKQILSMQSE